MTPRIRSPCATASESRLSTITPQLSPRTIPSAFASNALHCPSAAIVRTLLVTMLVSGDSGSSPKGGDAIQMAPGFALIEGVVVDQHFAERGRMGRLIAAIAQNPKSLGLGLDEDTAVVVERSRFTVVGSGGVYVIDGAGVTFSTVADVEDDEPFSVHDAKVHVLAPGDRFDLKQRRPVRSEKKE